MHNNNNVTQNVMMCHENRHTSLVTAQAAFSSRLRDLYIQMLWLLIAFMHVIISIFLCGFGVIWTCFISLDSFMIGWWTMKKCLFSLVTSVLPHWHNHILSIAYQLVPSCNVTCCKFLSRWFERCLTFEVNKISSMS